MASDGMQEKARRASISVRTFKIIRIRIKIIIDENEKSFIFIVSFFVFSENINLSELKNKRFFLVCDYAWVQDLKDAYLTFDAMDQIKSNAKSKNQTLDENTEDIDDIDYFLSMSDNLCPLDP